MSNGGIFSIVDAEHPLFVPVPVDSVPVDAPSVPDVRPLNIKQPLFYMAPINPEPVSGESLSAPMPVIFPTIVE